MSTTESCALSAEELCWRCDPAQFAFETTADLPDLSEIIGQPRAVEAIRFGIQVRSPGYNMFALGPNGIGKTTTVDRFLVREAAQQPVPDDWCYVHNFRDPRRPRALRLPAGMGTALRADVKQLIAGLRTAILAAFESEDYEAHTQAIQQKVRGRQEEVLGKVRALAEQRGIAMVKTPEGIGFAPVAGGKPISPEEFHKLPAEQREMIQRNLAYLEEQLGAAVRELSQAEKAIIAEARQLNRQVAAFAAGRHVQELIDKYARYEDIVDYFKALQEDVLDNVEDFRPAEQQEQAAEPSLERYEVNLIVDRTTTQGAPIVIADNPTYQNLLGTIEYRSEMGTLVTDLTLIKAGALHRANGGYLIIEAAPLLQKPFAWEALKRALRTGRIAIESLAQELSPVSTVTLEPEPIPLRLKVVLIGDPLLYYLLYEHDPDMRELFKVQVDFAEDMPCTPENMALYARFVATIA
ncbi:MAG TPA: ATP-binding protein, partial [Anaerolineae bacterium]|nr:ATP-binding protein [Anaerolineae bacterium]